MCNKKVLLTSALFCAMLSPKLFASDGVITFTGKVQDAACSIVAGDENQTVPMGTVATRAFAAAGDLAAPTRFDIRLENCPAGVASNGQVSIRFDGDTDPSKTSDGKLLKNDSGTGMAGNVAIGIWNINDPMNIKDVLGRGVDSTPVTIDYTSNPAAGEAKLSFMSRYVATDPKVTAGDVKAVSQFTIMYN